MNTRTQLVYLALAAVVAGAAFVGAFLNDDDSSPETPAASSVAASPAPSHVSGTPVPVGQAVVAERSTVNEQSVVTPTKPSLTQRAASVGYGSFIGNALVSADPVAKFEAAKLLRECQRIDQVADRQRELLNQDVGPGKSNTAFRYAVDSYEQIRRHCQAITAEQYKQQLTLLEEAVRGAVPGAASEYYMKIPAATAHTLPWLATALRQDADLGDVAAMRTMACDAVGESLPVVQRRAYVEALRTVAQGKSPASFLAAAIGEFCSRPPDPNVAVDPAVVQGLVAKAMAFDS